MGCCGAGTTSSLFTRSAAGKADKKAKEDHPTANTNAGAAKGKGKGKGAAKGATHAKGLGKGTSGKGATGKTRAEHTTTAQRRCT